MGQAVEDGVVVSTQAGGEGSQVGLVVGFDRGDPVVEPLSLSCCQDLGEGRDMRGEGVEMRAVGAHSCELVAFVVGEAVRVGEQSAGQLAGLWWPPRRRRTTGGGAQRP
jgi:hypothetical protein